jgi:hypothetical protein
MVKPSALPPDVQAAKERMNQADAALHADVESGQPYNAERRHRLLDNLKRATDEYLDRMPRLRPWARITNATLRSDDQHLPRS